MLLSSTFLRIHDCRDHQSDVHGEYEAPWTSSQRPHVSHIMCHALLSYDIPFQLALPACTWPFCLSTLIFLLISSEIPAICRLPPSVVSYPRGEPQLPETISGLRECPAEQQPRRGPAKGERRSKCPGGIAEGGCSASAWLERMLGPDVCLYEGL